MLSTMFNRGSLPALEALMQYTSARHKAIANNIANVETVGYKAMDMFKSMSAATMRLLA